MVPHVAGGTREGDDSVAPPGNQAANREYKQAPTGCGDGGGKARRAHPCRGTGGRKVETGGSARCSTNQRHLHECQQWLTPKETLRPPCNGPGSKHHSGPNGCGRPWATGSQEAHGTV